MGLQAAQATSQCSYLNSRDKNLTEGCWQHLAGNSSKQATEKSSHFKTLPPPTSKVSEWSVGSHWLAALLSGPFWPGDVGDIVFWNRGQKSRKTKFGDLPLYSDLDHSRSFKLCQELHVGISQILSFDTHPPRSIGFPLILYLLRSQKARCVPVLQSWPPLPDPCGESLSYASESICK